MSVLGDETTTRGVNWPPPPVPPPPPPPPPTPGTALYFAPDVLAGATEAQRRAASRVQLLFAAKVSRAAAEAYTEIARILGEEERNPNDT